MGKYLAGILLFCALACAPVSAVSLEQVRPVMPNIDVYLHGSGEEFSALSTADIQAALDGETLSVDALRPSEESIYYAFLLDVSRSISEAHLEAAKQAVLSTYEKLRAQDTLAVFTFGNEVKTLLQGGESADQVRQTLSTLRCTDSNTRFYDAMSALVETASSREQMRRIAVVVSDGIDDTQTGMTRQALEQTLRQSGVAVYALAPDSAPASALKSFREFIDITGGALYAFSPDNAHQQLSLLLDRIDEIWKLTLRADSNLADGQEHLLELRFAARDSLAVQIRPVEWVPDDKPPYVKSLSADTDAGTLTVTFSEPMLGLEEPGHYLLHAPDREGAALQVVSAQKDCVTLSADTLSTDPGWTLECTGLCDDSMEQNPMPASTIPLAGLGASASAQEPAEAGAAAAKRAAADSLLHTALILVGAAAAGVALTLVLLRKRRVGRREKPEKKAARRPAQAVRFFFSSDSDDQKKS